MFVANAAAVDINKRRSKERQKEKNPNERWRKSEIEKWSVFFRLSPALDYLCHQFQVTSFYGYFFSSLAE